MPYLTNEKKASFFNTYGGSVANTGSIEAIVS
jgi:hypothetical protein